MKAACPTTAFEEPFMITAMLSLVGGSAWMWRRHELLLHYFYMPELLALTHLLTLGFITGVSMGVVQRLLPGTVKVQPRSRRLGGLQFALFLLGGAGMVYHFLIAQWSGMAWATLLVLGAAVVQLINLSAVFGPARRGDPVACHVAAALLFFVLAATLGVLLGLNKGFEFDFALLPAPFLSTLFAHVHLAAIGWVTNLIFGFQLKLVPTTARASRRWLIARFWLLQAGVLGMAATLLTRAPGTVFFSGLVFVAIAWHTWGPTHAVLRGRVREWAVVPLWLLTLGAATGTALAAGFPGERSVLHARVQLAYAYTGLVGWIVLTVVVMAFKLFPMWVWQERFQREHGKRPVPAMSTLYSHALRTASNLFLLVGVVGTTAAILAASGPGLAVFTGCVLLGVLMFLINFIRMARWALLDLEYHPSQAEWDAFHRDVR